ncbi:PX-associated-domain-containing protein [Stachybotrys elegans]|uniref:PX-associated-domain-containing protein n=1 Tax=Stachybotrys elegans TaxID=80388 RepID=A0A8K0WKV1_9HYPO|nr:PX-associated-domain-containing protein [Stachybotrys elegans]
MASVPALTPAQTHALLDILTHNQTYAEIQGFRSPGAVTSYGFPFARATVVPTSSSSAAPSVPSTPAASVPGTPRARTPLPPDDDDDDDDGGGSTSPLLQTLLTRVVLRLPAIRDLPRDFWSVRVQGLLARLGEANLSESYDKGALGTRKTLATGASSVIEMVARGALSGVAKQDPDPASQRQQYDHTKAEDLERAWNDVVQGLVHGHLWDDMFAHLSKTEDLESYSPAVKAAAEYAIIHLATLAHHIFVLSPEGQYVLKLLENLHGLAPYKMIRQTLRVGNAATMISGMVRLMLAKISVTSLTNWFGLTQNADDGMNLLQRMIWLVLSWDASEFKKSSDRVERAKERPSDAVLAAIREHVSDPRPEHEAVRAASRDNSQSIIAAILYSEDPALVATLTESTHAQCLEYYSALLSIRDREAITTALCRQPPDLFTQMVRDAVTAYEPIIRMVHSRVDLREHLEATQGFIDEFIKTSKPQKADGGSSDAAPPPTVEDYIDLFMRNRGFMYKWLHALGSKCPDVWEQLRQWTNEVMVKFRKGYPSDKPSAATDTMQQRLNDLFASLPPTAQDTVLSAINAHETYLSTITTLSRTRLQALANPKASTSRTTMHGPGVYLARWQNLLDDTAITPSTPKGAVRHGRDVKNTLSMGKTGVGSTTGPVKVTSAEEEPIAPDVSIVVKEMGPGFVRIVQEIGGPDS